MKGGFRNPLATNIAPGSVGNDQLADGAVSSVKIASNLQSDNWDGTTVAARNATQGWRLEKDTGDFGANDAVLRGTLIAGDDDRIVIDPEGFGVDEVSIDFIISNLPIGSIEATASALSIGTLAPFLGAPTSPILIGASEHIKLTANGHIELQTDDIILDADQVLFPGQNGPPGLAVIGDEDTGIGWISQGRITVRSNGDLALDIQGAKDLRIPHNTTANSANCFIGSNGQILRNTSSRKYKRKITDWKPRKSDWNKIRVRGWESDIKGEKGKRFKGFVFEELPSVFQGHEVEDLRAIVAATVSRLKEVEAVVYA